MNAGNLAFDAKAEVGEGPCWDSVRHVLYWVDITQSRVHIYDPSTGQNRTIQLDRYVGAAVPRKSGGLMLAMGTGFYHLDPDTEQATLLASVEGNEQEIRFNDGKVDPMGRFWAGTMKVDGEAGAGSLYVLDTDLSVRKMVSGVSVSNGLAWSPDHTKMYYIDTAARQISRFDYDAETGSIGNRQAVVVFAERDGLPDGMAMDEEGMLWVAFWGGRQVSRIDPQTGDKLQIIEPPAPLTSSCAFGGKDLDELYVTTARLTLSEEELNAYPLSGGLFCFKMEVKGLAEVEFEG